MTTRARPSLARASTLPITLSIVAYRLVVDFGYRILVAEPFSYQGFQNAPTIGTIVVSWAFLLTLLPLLVRVVRSEALSSQFTGMLAMISLIPTTALIAHDPRYPALYVLLIFVYWLLFLLAAVFVPSIHLLRRPLRSEVPHMVASVVLAGTVLYISWRYTGFRLHFGIWDIYDLRTEAREFDMPAVLGYFLNFADNVLPVLLAYYLRRRWYLVGALVSVVILFNYGISATKQVLFLLMFAVASVLVADPPRFNRRITAVLAAVTLVGVLEAWTTGTLFVGTLSVYRVFAIPAHLHWLYFEFFQEGPLLLLTQSTLKYFFQSPYEENVQFLVSYFWSGIITGRANNGLFSDGYMNFGAVSVLFYPIACVVVLKILEGAAKGLSASVQFILVVSLSFVFLGLPLPTAVLSAGVGALILLLHTLPRRDGGPDDIASRQRTWPA